METLNYIIHKLKSVFKLKTEIQKIINNMKLMITRDLIFDKKNDKLILSLGEKTKQIKKKPFF